MMKTSRLLGTLLATTLGCGPGFLDPEDYEPLPAFESLDWSQVGPSSPIAIWELREGVPGGGPHTVLARGVAASHDPVPPHVLAAFNAAQASNGFDPACMPAYCFKYFVSLEGTTIRVWDTVEEAREFLGVINNRVEAALIAKVHGYHWVPGEHTAGIRDVDSGWEMVALDLVRLCDPIQYDRLVLHIALSGTVGIVKREVWERQHGLCI